MAPHDPLKVEEREIVSRELSGNKSARYIGRLLGRSDVASTAIFFTPDYDLSPPRGRGWGLGAPFPSPQTLTCEDTAGRWRVVVSPLLAGAG